MLRTRDILELAGGFAPDLDVGLGPAPALDSTGGFEPPGSLDAGDSGGVAAAGGVE
ncbi:MAG TPA: hypothetical protein VFG23_21330 [Polyangia bacterium]|nr:hypothetical protein [Polyangia bacterium]